MKWADPPSAKGGPNANRWSAILPELQERPGEWALVMESASISNASNLRARFGRDGFEFVSRSDGTGKADIYARFVGVPS